MYNINSGVQFVGRPVEPPPYSEVVASPPREGPPPPYVSCENLIHQPPPATITTDSINLCPSDNSLMIVDNNENSRDHDLISATNTSRNIPGPQVPTGSLASALMTDVSYDDTDNINSKLVSTVQTLELEYVETDALLPQSSHTNKMSISKDPIWKSYNRHTHGKDKWLINKRNDEVTDEQLYDNNKVDKTVQSSSVRGKFLSMGNCENEGIFLETDQQESSSSINNLSSQPDNIDILSKNNFDRTIAGPSSCHENKNILYDNKIIKQTSNSTTMHIDELDACNTSLNSSCIRPCHDFSVCPSPTQSNNFVINSNFETCHNNHRSNKPHESSINPSTTLITTDNVDNAVNNTDTSNQQQEARALVLPLRESFIGIQKDS